MSRFLKILMVSVIMVSLTACPGGKDDPKPEEGGDPGSVTLVFPENNTECTEGLVINDAQSTVIFQWEAAQNVDSYEVNLRNLATGVLGTANSDTNELGIVLERGVPYEWFVISRKEGANEAPQSSTWRFYNQGPGQTNYAPFPAEAVKPTRGQTLTASGGISLEWQGSDVDNDIVGYEVRFGTDVNPTAILGATAQTTMETTVSSGQTYYWRVFTADAAGNTSQSEVFEFRVQ
ncbi:hypothetical protein N9954_08715 [Maribacter sp.]|nr:hypothetical protein [Maribacter sp.]